MSRVKKLDGFELIDHGVVSSSYERPDELQAAQVYFCDAVIRALLHEK